MTLATLCPSPPLPVSRLSAVGGMVGAGRSHIAILGGRGGGKEDGGAGITLLERESQVEEEEEEDLQTLSLTSSGSGTPHFPISSLPLLTTFSSLPHSLTHSFLPSFPPCLLPSLLSHSLTPPLLPSPQVMLSSWMVYSCWLRRRRWRSQRASLEPVICQCLGQLLPLRNWRRTSRLPIS